MTGSPTLGYEKSGEARLDLDHRAERRLDDHVKRFVAAGIGWQSMQQYIGQPQEPIPKRAHMRTQLFAAERLHWIEGRGLSRRHVASSRHRDSDQRGRGPIRERVERRQGKQQ
jgi:hypothetical protein